jgi:hypothetical protein
MELDLHICPYGVVPDHRDIILHAKHIGTCQFHTCSVGDIVLLYIKKNRSSGGSSVVFEL